MARWSSILLPGAVLISLAGCGNRSSEGPSAQSEKSGPGAKAVGGVAVVDLDLLAKRLGRHIEMNSSIQEKLALLNSKLTTLQTKLKELYDEKRHAFGAEPSDDQRKQLQAMKESMDGQVLEKKREGEAELQAFKLALVDQFREQAKPVLRDVAAARGLGIGVPKNNNLFLTVDPAVEITDEVAEKMIASQSPRSPAPVEQARKKPEAETSAR